VKLLRVLQEQTFERLGSNRPVHVDVRIIAATHRPLEQMMASGDFRDDLFYRLNVVSIELPPLRDRREDIPGLVDQFLQRHGSESAGRVTGVSREALDLLAKYTYPGNVRELENIVRRALVLARGPLIGSYDLPPHVRGLAAEPEATGGSFPEQVARFERRLIADALAHAGGVQTRAARELGISERHLRSRLRRLGVTEPTRKPEE
jgi:two-component system NtrC family response regulator